MRSLAEKYDITREYEVECLHCKKTVITCNANMEVIGPYHTGCFGWPVCQCEKKHEGDCEGVDNNVKGQKADDHNR